MSNYFVYLSRKNRNYVLKKRICRSRCKFSAYFFTNCKKLLHDLIATSGKGQIGTNYRIVIMSPLARLFKICNMFTQANIKWINDEKNLSLLFPRKAETTKTLCRIKV